MKHFFKKYLIAFLIAGMMFACREEEPNESPVNAKSEAIEVARQWYEANKPPLTMIKSASAEDDSNSVILIPYWEQSCQRKKGKLRTVEAVMITKGRMIFMEPETAEKFRETKDKRYRQSLTRLVVLSDKETDNTVGFMMTIVPSLNYLEKTNFKPFKTSFLRRAADFDGKILFHNLEGKFVRGWKYADGKVTHKIKPVKTGDSEADIRLQGMVCYTDIIEYYVEDCTSWGYIGEGGEEIVTGEECVNGRYEYEYHEYCLWEDDGDDGSGYDEDYYCFSNPCACWGDCGGDGGFGNPNTDCAGVIDGSAYVDACGVCVGGTTGRTACTNTPNADKFYHPNSTLGLMEKKRLDEAFVDFKNKNYPAFTRLYNNLLIKGMKFPFKIDPTIDGNAAYNKRDRSISFKSYDKITCANLQEELIHAIQHDWYGNTMTNTVRNYEYEAKVFQDLTCWWYGCAYLGRPDITDIQVYTDWLDAIDGNGFQSSDIAKFNNFCSYYTAYGGTVDNNFTPEILEQYFSK